MNKNMILRWLQENQTAVMAELHKDYPLTAKDKAVLKVAKLQEEFKQDMLYGLIQRGVGTAYTFKGRKFNVQMIPERNYYVGGSEITLMTQEEQEGLRELRQKRTIWVEKKFQSLRASIMLEGASEEILMLLKRIVKMEA